MLLRAFVLVVGALIAAAGAWLTAAGPRGSGIYLLCVGAAIILGTLFERWRYHNTPPAAARWEPTGERFQDPATGETMTVDYDSVSGERRYVRAGEHASGR